MTPCTRCGGTQFVDGRCRRCGTPAPLDLVALEEADPSGAPATYTVAGGLVLTEITEEPPPLEAEAEAFRAPPMRPASRGGLPSPAAMPAPRFPDPPVARGAPSPAAMPAPRFPDPPMARGVPSPAAMPARRFPDPPMAREMPAAREAPSTEEAGGPTRTCSGCGATLAEPTPSFCEACGTRVPKLKTRAKGGEHPEQKKCKLCGFVNGVERPTCVNCGQRVFVAVT